MNRELRNEEAAWYDEFYQEIQTAWAPWYRLSIPHLRTLLTPQTRLLELGCGQGHLLRYLAGEKMLPEDNIYGLDQSRTAVDFVRERLPGAHLEVGDVYRLAYAQDFFQVCFLMETIEHFEEPHPALQQIFRVIAPGGFLFVSFPNFLNLPWLGVRLLGDLLNKPNWLVRQPVDKIYTVFSVIRIVERAGFTFARGIGCGYGPPILYRAEKEWMTRGLNKLGLWRLSFHPILVFRKPSAPAGPKASTASAA